MIKCNFTDIRNCWEMKDPIKIDGTWSSIQCELIKLAAKCNHYNSDIVIDINAIDKRIKSGEEFENHMYFYDCGVHSTLEYSGGTESEEWKCNEMKKHCDNIFATAYLKFSKVDTRDYELTFEFKNEYNFEIGSVVDLCGNGEEYYNVEITTKNKLPRDCEQIAWILNEYDFERYTIYKDCVTHPLYAVKENEDV